MANYDLNAMADAMRDLFQGEIMFQVNGLDVPLNVYSEVQGQAQVPAMVIELDDVDYDVTFARGSDDFTFFGIVLLQAADGTNAQRILRSALSSGGVATRVKDVLQANQNLSGTCSYAVMTGTRKIGTIQYAGLDYVGAELVIEVVAQ